MLRLSDVWFVVFFVKQKTAYEVRISDLSSDVCSSDLWPVTPEVAGSSPVHSASYRRGHRKRCPLFCLSGCAMVFPIAFRADRSEEHTSELQSLMRISYAVF